MLFIIMRTFVTHLNILISAIWTVLSRWTYRIAFVILAVLFVALYISIPVMLIPGNTFTFQLSLYTPADYTIFISISVLTSLLVLMQVFSFLRSRARTVRTIGRSSVGVFSGIFSGMFASVTCVPCAIGFLGIFGSAGSTLANIPENIPENTPTLLRPRITLYLFPFQYSPHYLYLCRFFLFFVRARAPCAPLDVAVSEYFPGYFQECLQA